MSCLFCDIAHRAAPGHIFWEDEQHVAFLAVAPSTRGATMVVPREHAPYAFAMQPEALAALMLAAQRVVGILDSYFSDADRTMMVLRGERVAHVHAKLYPLREDEMDIAHGSGQRWPRAEGAELASLAAALRAHAECLLPVA